jgi:hypothetical protein
MYAVMRSYSGEAGKKLAARLEVRPMSKRLFAELILLGTHADLGRLSDVYALQG